MFETSSPGGYNYSLKPGEQFLQWVFKAASVTMLFDYEVDDNVRGVGMNPLSISRFPPSFTELEDMKSLRL